MKNKKNIYKKIFICIYVIFLIFYLFNTQETFALKRAIFPDEKSLQPIPTDIEPNISGNINSTINTPNILDKETSGETLETNAFENPQQNEIKNQKNWESYILWFFLLLFIVLTSFFVYRNKKRRKN